MAKNRVNKFVESLRERQDTDSASHNGTAAANPVAAREAVKPPGIPFFDPQMLSKLGRLDLISRNVVDGFLSGKHRSTHKGGCTDFAEFRPYAHGDDIRLLDWRHYARSDRYYVKRYDDETNLQALLIVDTSGSMNFGLSTVSKWRYAQMAAASLAHLLLRQRDSVGLALVGQSQAAAARQPFGTAVRPARLDATRRPIDDCRRAVGVERAAPAAGHGGVHF